MGPSKQRSFPECSTLLSICSKVQPKKSVDPSMCALLMTKSAKSKEKIGLGFSVSPSQTNFCVARLRHAALESVLLYLGLELS